MAQDWWILADGLEEVMIICTTCGTDTDRLEIFPGDVCITCWAASPAGRYLPTSDELIAMWGGR